MNGTTISCESTRRCCSKSSLRVPQLPVPSEALLTTLQAANYLEIKDLLDAGCKTVSNIIRGATPTDLLRNCDIANGFDGRGGRCPEEIRRAFNITNDFTAEEEEQIRRENDWAGDS